MDQLLTNIPEFNFNPFSGLSDDEIAETIVPNVSIEKVIKNIENEKVNIIELYGQKGRGKTTHLRLLHKLFKKAPLYQLNKKVQFEKMINDPSNIIFVDSIHFLNLFQRIKLFKSKSKIILTTHHSKKLEYKLANVSSERFHFKGLDHATLTMILQKRIFLALKNKNEAFHFNEQVVDQLLDKYKDDYRGIMHCLFEQFQLKMHQEYLGMQK